MFKGMGPLSMAETCTGDLSSKGGCVFEVSGEGFILHLKLEDFQHFLGKGTNCKISYAYIWSVSNQLMKFMVYGVTATE